MNHSKKAAELSVERVPLRQLTPENLARLYRERGTLDLESDVYELLEADLDEALAVAGIPDAQRLRYRDLHGANRPLAGRSFATPAEAERAVVNYTAENLASSADPDNLAAAIVFDTLLQAYVVIGEHLRTEWLDEKSKKTFPGSWMSFFSFQASGPPPHRLAQILALNEAGIVHFVGPDTRIEATERGFAARSERTASPEPAIETQALVQAYLSLPTAAQRPEPFIAGLVESGLGAPDEESGRLAIDKKSYRLLSGKGSAHETLWAAGPHTPETPIGAFARPNTDAVVFRRNAELAEAIIHAAEEVERGRARKNVNRAS